MSTITQMTAVPADTIGATPTAAPPPPATPPVAKPASADAPPPTAAVTPASKSSSEDSQRLTISEGHEPGVLIYTILDRASGLVLLQIPRPEVEKLANRPDYTAGKVIDTKA